MTKLLSSKEVANALGYKKKDKAIQLIKAGALPATWIGRGWKVQEKHLEEFLDYSTGLKWGNEKQIAESLEILSIRKRCAAPTKVRTSR